MAPMCWMRKRAFRCRKIWKLGDERATMIGGAAFCFFCFASSDAIMPSCLCFFRNFGQ